MRNNGPAVGIPAVWGLFYIKHEDFNNPVISVLPRMRAVETENNISSVSVSPEEGRYIYSTRDMMKPPSIIVATDRKPFLCADMNSIIATLRIIFTCHCEGPHHHINAAVSHQHHLNSSGSTFLLFPS